MRQSWEQQHHSILNNVGIFSKQLHGLSIKKKKKKKASTLIIVISKIVLNWFKEKKKNTVYDLSFKEISTFLSI